MNAPLRLSAIPRQTLARACALGMLGLGLSGCAGGDLLALGPIDPKSPVAAEVAATARENRSFPTFASIPPIPADQRPFKAWGRSAQLVETAGAELERATADNTWSLTGTETFAANALRVVGPPIAGPESTTAATEAFARDLRKRATPPPPPKR